MAKDNTKKSTELAPTWPFNWSSLDRAFDNFRREFERHFSTLPSFPNGSASMSCDVADEGDKYTIKLEIPGVKKNEIDLNIFDNSIEVSAEHKEEEEEKKKNYLRKERSEVSYYRTIPLPEKITTDKTQAKLTDGVLTITAPKITPTPTSKGKSIQVQ